MTNETRLFFVVDSVDDNEELFETLESAQKYLSTLDQKREPCLRVCFVRNAYKEADGTWNYKDLWDTFFTVKNLYQNY